MSFRFFSGKDYFAALNLSTSANDDEIKKSFRYFSRVYHPDRNSGNDNGTFIKINKAYETLSNAKLRQVCQLHLHNEELGEYLDNVAQANDADHALFDSLSVDELLRRFDEFRFYKKTGKPRIRLDKTIIHVDQSLVEQQFTYGKKFSGSVKWAFCSVKGANFGFDDEFLYNKKKFFYGFDVEHKGYKRKNQKKLTIFGNLYDYHLSMYKLSAHFQHPLARVEPFVTTHDFFTQDMKSILAEEDELDTFSRNILLNPGCKLRIHHNYVFKKDISLSMDEIRLSRTPSNWMIKSPIKITVKKTSLSFCPFTKVMVLEYKSDQGGSFLGMSLQPLLRISISDWLEMYRDPSLEMIWDCISPVISLKFIRHGVKTSLDQISITDIIDAITVKSPDVQNAVKSTDEAGNPILLAENRLMLSLSYLLQSNQVILSTPISIPISYYSMTKSPESAIQRVILPFLFMVAIRNETIQEKTKSLLSYLSSFWHRRRTE